MPLRTIEWVKNNVKIIDQRKLPLKLEYVICKDVKTLWLAIKTLTIRGAPALGVAAAFAVLLGLKDFRGNSRGAFDKFFNRLCAYIGSSRPTAVNLFNALAQMKNVLDKNPTVSVDKLKTLLKKEAFEIFDKDRTVCRKIGKNGFPLIKNGSRILTICNTGALVTVDYGTALGVMYSAKAQGKRFKVYACETRPLLQGARLTTWELMRAGIDVTLITDSMAATLMRQRKIDMVITGADRIALNGDAANKIGTYNLAVLAHYHKIPFYIAAPLTTFDRKTKTGRDIPIEERDSKEITEIKGVRIAPKGVKVYNPAFDVTDNCLIAGIITEKGILRRPFGKGIKKMLARYR